MMLSQDAQLVGLVLDGITLDPAFDGATTAYTASVPNMQSTTSVTATVRNASATLTVNGTATQSGQASATLVLGVPSTLITVLVTAQDGVTQQTYTVTVSRAPSANADLSGISLSAGTLRSAFAPGTLAYTADIPALSSSITITATTADPSAALTVDGVMASSGQASQAISVPVGSSAVDVVVTAQDGITTRTYSLTLVRPQPPSTNARLSSLVASSGMLVPAFDPDTTTYALAVGYSVTGLRLTPTLEDASATLTVAGNMVASGVQSGDVPLAVGSNMIAVQVTAEDTTTVRTYTLNVTRAAAAYLAATGGTITTVGDFRVHTFTSSGTFQVTSLGDVDNTVEYLLVGGGGAGGFNLGGGGGGGGYVEGSSLSVSVQAYPVVVGAGGQPVASDRGQNGANTTFAGMTALGGGGGGRSSSGNINGSNGGSGGGGGGDAASTPGSGSGTQGFGGGARGVTGPGGGGGAGQPGSAGGEDSAAGAGGEGRASSIDGTLTYRGGGGSGGSGNGRGAPGGAGGGGAAGTQGTPGTGGGGGGASTVNGSGAAGGSGVVIIRYRVADTRPVNPTYTYAEGGHVTTSGNFRIHTFAASGTLRVLRVGTSAAVDYLVIAGGGAGGYSAGGGGGAGGYLEGTLSLGLQDYSVVVGRGGVALPADRGESGAASTFAGVSATGGGGGGRSSTGAYTGSPGGSGGGGGGDIGGATGGSPSSGQGFSGGSGAGLSQASGGGGGGAGAVGNNGSGSNGGAGGAGKASTITGSSVTRAGGGGGGRDAGGAGGAGGGGARGAPGVAGTGSGGGSANFVNGPGRPGGSGVVIVRYRFQ